MLLKRILSLVLCSSCALVVLSACQSERASAYSISPTNTPAVIETQAQTSAEATVISTPTITVRTSTEVIVVPQPTPYTETQPTASLPGNRIPQALIQIISPGPGSQLSHEFTLRVSAYPGDKGNVTIRLFGEDGRVIKEIQEKVTTPANGWVSLAESINFSTEAAGEAAVLSVSTADGYGRRISLSSVKLILLQIGPNEVEAAGFRGDPFVVTSPTVGGTVKGGVVHIEGAAHPFSSQPLIAELITTDGQVLASGQVKLAALPVGGKYVPFSLDIPYQVNISTPVRLTLRQVYDHPYGVDAALSSQLIFLNP